MGVAALDARTLQALIAQENAALVEATALSFRSETRADLDFSASLYAHTRADELRAVAWPEAQKRAFCRQQFDAQHAHYEKHYPRAQFLIIESHSKPIGRVYFEQTARELRLMEITLEPGWRNRGIGGAISTAIVAHARALGIAAGLHVESFNPAKRLYERQGFRDVETRGIYVYMRVEPQPDAAARVPA